MALGVNTSALDTAQKFFYVFCLTAQFMNVLNYWRESVERFTEFIRLWQKYQTAIDNGLIARLCILPCTGDVGTYRTIIVREWKELKHATMLEF